MGYISGIGNMMQVVGFQERLHPDQNYTALAICGSMTNAAMVQAFRNWAQKNPQEWTSPQFSGVMAALIETWPCPLIFWRLGHNTGRSHHFAAHQTGLPPSLALIQRLISRATRRPRAPRAEVPGKRSLGLASLGTILRT